jgi:EAL domain-containing protein (putative c-di-GMP-specific phosphodiesterase class I)
MKNTPQINASHSSMADASDRSGRGTARWFLSGQTDTAGPIRRIGINTSPFVVGRVAEASLRLDTRSVSKNHAELLLEGEDLWIRDLNSTNGTYANGEKVSGLTKLNVGDLVQFATLVFRVGRDEAKTMGHTSAENDVCDQALAIMQFDRLINDGGVFPFYQPIVTMTDQNPVAFEILGRSRLFGLTTPAEMFSAAQQLNQVTQLSDVFRSLGVDTAVKNKLRGNLFMNTHPDELGTKGLFESLQLLRRTHPEQPLTLEIHEKAVTDCQMIRELRDILRDLNIQLAFDDFGEGQARLVELSEVKPDYLKFDMGLTRMIHSATPERQKVVSMIVRMVNELGIVSLAEGVEEAEDHAILAQMGFQLGQGFYYGRPAPISKYIAAQK